MRDGRWPRCRLTSLKRRTRATKLASVTLSGGWFKKCDKLRKQLSAFEEGKHLVIVAPGSGQCYLVKAYHLPCCAYQCCPFMLVLFWGVLCLILCASKLKAAPRLMGLVALLVGLNELTVMLPIWWHPLTFGLQMNWTGKLLSTLLSLLVIYAGRMVSPQEVGLSRPLRDSWRLVVLVVLVLAFANFAGGFFNRHQHAPPSWEAHVYELIMPGLAEELFLRGVFLGLLSRVFPRTIPFFGTRTSWGGLAGLVLFVLGHCLSFHGPLALLPHTYFSLDKVLGVGVYGTLYLWVRERSGSCWAAMAAHNLTNVGLYMGLSMP